MTEDKAVNPWKPSSSQESQQILSVSSQSSLSLSDLTSSNSSSSDKSLEESLHALEPKEKEIDYLYFNHQNLANHCHRRIEIPNTDSILEQTNQDVDCISKESSDTDSISSRIFQEEMSNIYASWKDGIYPIRSFPYRPLQTATAAGIAFKKNATTHSKHRKSYKKDHYSSRCYTRTLNINPAVNKLLRNLDRELQELVATAVFGDNQVNMQYKKQPNSQKKCQRQGDIRKVSFQMEQVGVAQRHQKQLCETMKINNDNTKLPRKKILIKDQLSDKYITHLCLI